VPLDNAKEDAAAPPNVGANKEDAAVPPNIGANEELASAPAAPPDVGADKEDATAPPKAKVGAIKDNAAAQEALLDLACLILCWIGLMGGRETLLLLEDSWT
jgi:hypothetical protein